MTSRQLRIHGVRRYTKFLLIGLANAAIDLMVLNVLLILFPTRSGFWLTTYNTAGVVCAILNSYYWNRHWAFKDVANGSGMERVKFVSQSLLNILLNDVIVVFATKYITSNRALPYVLSSDLAKAIAMFSSSSLTYVFLKKFVFHETK